MLSYETISPHTLELLKGLMAEPMFASLRLVEGTALALQYGHRSSIDLDFFGEITEDAEDIKDVLWDEIKSAVCNSVKKYSD